MRISINIERFLNNKFAVAILLLLFPFLIQSCYKEVVIPEPDADCFELLIGTTAQEFIYSSRDTSYSIMDSDPTLVLNGATLDMKEMRIRGKSALNFRRKSYGVFLNEPIHVMNRDGTDTKMLSRFKLISLASDYTYIENRIAFGILEEAGVMPLFYKFVEFKINNETQGVYMLIEDPEQYYIEIGSEYIIRRGYNHSILDSEYFPQMSFTPESEYSASYFDIYNNLTELSGDDLYSLLDNRLNIESYFHKIGIDYLLRNGDYTDEIYLYSEVVNDTIRFNVIPWDYDDIFDDIPHEVGVKWGIGTLYGPRQYDTQQDIYDEIGDKLIFSIEDDLDYTIALDPIIYKKYLESLERLMIVVNESLIDRVFEETKNELSSFYDSYNVISQSRFDAARSNFDLWQTNMEEKKLMIKERLNSIQASIATQNQ